MSASTLPALLTEVTTKLTYFYLITIYFIGLFGNLINIIIFLRTQLRSNVCSQYFIALSLSQIILFNSLPLTRIITTLVNYDLGQTIASLCKIRSYLFIFSLALTRQFLCLISIDRWIVTTRNTHIRSWSSIRIVRWLIICSTVFWLLFSIHILVGYQISPIRGCTQLVNSNYAFFFGIQFALSSIIPFFIMLIFSILTLYNVRNRRRRVFDNTVSIPTETTVTIRSTVNHRRYEMQLIKLSLLQVLFYLFLSMLGTGFPLYSVLTSSYVKSPSQLAIDLFLNNLSLLLIYTYSAVGLSFLL